jgi:N-acetylneuraminic acid mutarotase
MAEDAATGTVVLYGGYGSYPMGSGISLEPVRDTKTWILDPRTATWTSLQTPTIPEMRQEMGMAYVASLGAVVMATGGTVAGCQSWTNSAYAYDVAAKDWRKVTTSGALPTARNAATLTANLCDGSAILTGGTHDNKLPITLADRAWILR